MAASNDVFNTYFDGSADDGNMNEFLDFGEPEKAEFVDDPDFQQTIGSLLYLEAATLNTVSEHTAQQNFESLGMASDMNSGLQLPHQDTAALAINSNTQFSRPSENDVVSPIELFAPSEPNAFSHTGNAGKRNSDELEAVPTDSSAQPPKPKRTRKTKPKPQPSPEEADKRRRDFLQRNKEAATKCRHKKKESNDRLVQALHTKRREHFDMYEQLKQDDAVVVQRLADLEKMGYHGQCACGGSTDEEVRQYQATIAKLKQLHLQNEQILQRAAETEWKQNEADRLAIQQAEEAEVLRASKGLKPVEKRTSEDSTASSNYDPNIDPQVMQPRPFAIENVEMQNRQTQGFAANQYPQDLQQNQQVPFQQVPQQSMQQQYPSGFMPTQQAMSPRQSVQDPGTMGMQNPQMVQQEVFNNYNLQQGPSLGHSRSRNASVASIGSQTGQHMARNSSSSSHHSQKISRDGSMYDSPGSTGHSQTSSYDPNHDLDLSVSNGNPPEALSPFSCPPHVGEPMVASGSNESNGAVPYGQVPFGYQNDMGQPPTVEYMQQWGLLQMPSVDAKGPKDLMYPLSFLQMDGVQHGL